MAFRLRGGEQSPSAPAWKRSEERHLLLEDRFSVSKHGWLSLQVMIPVHASSVKPHSFAARCVQSERNTQTRPHTEPTFLQTRRKTTRCLICGPRPPSSGLSVNFTSVLVCVIKRTFIHTPAVVSCRNMVIRCRNCGAVHGLLCEPSTKEVHVRHFLCLHPAAGAIFSPWRVDSGHCFFLFVVIPQFVTVKAEQIDTAGKRAQNKHKAHESLCLLLAGEKEKQCFDLLTGQIIVCYTLPPHQRTAGEQRDEVNVHITS